MSNPNKDNELLAVLDDYLARLQSGEQPSRESLLEEHPDLASALDCLDALDSLAPDEPKGSRIADEPTMRIPEPMANLPRIFGQYELLDEIGRGGMGVVYMARQSGLDRTVAIKMILAGHMASREHVRRFQAEAKATAQLRHPNIVHIHEVGQIHGQDYFAMELVEGESLAQRLAREPVDIETAVRLLGSVARAVDHLHGQGIVHRDLKPSNILLDEDGQPMVSDFGLAKMFSAGSEMTASGVITGTPSYMAPEQAAGHNSEVGPAADIYSLGAILYEMLTGRPPFHCENPLDTLMEVLSREPIPLRRLSPRISRSLELICLKCLAKSPKDRYETAGALAEDLDRFARGEALLARPPSIGQKLWSWTRRQPALVLRLAVLAVFYLVANVNFIWFSEVTQVDAPYYWTISLLLAAWAIGSVICQQGMESQRWSISTRFVWGTLDSALLLAVLLVSDGAASPLIVAYPLLIVASAFWFRVRFVWFIGGLSLLSYGVLIVDFYWRRDDAFREQFDTTFDRHMIFLVALLLLGLMVAYLVHRVRTLSRYYGRPLP